MSKDWIISTIPIIRHKYTFSAHVENNSAPQTQMDTNVCAKIPVEAFQYVFALGDFGASYGNNSSYKLNIDYLTDSVRLNLSNKITPPRKIVTKVLEGKIINKQYFLDLETIMKKLKADVDNNNNNNNNNNNRTLAIHFQRLFHFSSVKLKSMIQVYVVFMY